MRRCLSVISLVVAVGSCGGGKKAGRPFHALPPLGARLLVLAPHPDDEVLGAAGSIRGALSPCVGVCVVLGQEGEAGAARVRAGNGLSPGPGDDTRPAPGRLGPWASAVTV